MSRRRTIVRESHHGLGLIGSAVILLLAVTGFGLQHPTWFGRTVAGACAVAADPRVEGRLLRAAPALLEVSEDGGTGWRDLPLSAVPDQPVAIRFHGPAGEVWLLGETELLKSTDGGLIWDEVALPAAVGLDEPACDLTLLAGRPVVVTRRGAWTAGEAGAWVELWHTPLSGSDRARAWFHRLHTGRWGGALVPRFYDADTLHQIHDDIEGALGSEVHAGDVVVHFDPCRPPYCKGCAVEDCPVRSTPFESRVPLDRGRAVRDDAAAEPPPD